MRHVSGGIDGGSRLDTSLRAHASLAISDICGELDEAFSSPNGRRKFVLPHNGCFAAVGTHDTGSGASDVNGGGYFFLQASGRR
ncbi:hypothetical protein QMZ05_00955 [Bradyrhizobium sp. INPA03-11B]|uniref:hypothetical protein n=1 Tax=Bradyrhizobium sp. INPA03-11B TaxID=418598 RepID=UPI00338DE671